MKINWELVIIVLIASITISNIVNAIRDTICFKYHIKEIENEEEKEND